MKLKDFTNGSNEGNSSNTGEYDPSDFNAAQKEFMYCLQSSEEMLHLLHPLFYISDGTVPRDGNASNNPNSQNTIYVDHRNINGGTSA